MKIIFAFIALFFLLGCTSSPAKDGDASPSPPPAAPLPESPAGEAPPGEAPAEPPEPPPVEDPLEGKTLEEIAASGSPAECVVRFTYQNKPATAKFYFRGTQEMRFEETSSGLAQCQRTITVIRDGRRYAGCEGKTVMPSCDWFRSDQSGGLPQQFQGLSADDADCASWAYDPSMFATPGQSCSLG